MLGTSAVKQYFSTGDSHYVVPAVSAEWNYNLFYAPYATFAGDGTALSSNWKTPGSWSTSNCTATYESTGGRGLNGYTDTSVLKFAATGQNGSGSLTVTTSGAADTYKIIFYAKTVENVEVTLTSLAYIDSHRSDSKSLTIDNTTWTKFELYASSRPIDTTYSSFNLSLDFTSRDTTIASKVGTAPSSYTVLVDQFEIFKSTAFDYQYGNLWKTDSPFGFFRPGESYVPSGNVLTPLPSGFRTVNTQFPKGSNSTFWDAQSMPCSPVVFHPQALGSSKSNPLYKNGILSDYTTYKYFVSDGITNSIGALYDNLMETNKLVLKFNVAYSTPTSVTINLYNTVTSYSKTITITDANISSAGVCILYLQTNGEWTTTPWSTMPTFNNQGAITLSQAINKIVLTQNSATIKTEYASPSADIVNNLRYSEYGATISVPGRYTQYQADMKRLQVVEISPRIELDLTNFVMNVETTSELDNKQNPLPISAISSNSAQIHLSNIPFNVSGYVLSIFSNNSSKSPLSGLFKKNVKFYVNYVIKDTVVGATSADKVIPGGIWYAENWDGQDLQKTTVTAFDVSKYLQLLSPTDYVSKSQDVFNVITNILDLAGFTDYDYDSLRKVTISNTTLVDGSIHKNKQAIDSSFFYADGQQQKVFDVLRELFEVYQIGAYIDSYGVMKFLSLDNILSNTQPNLLLHDNSTPQSITTAAGYTDNLTVTSNITQDTYTEQVKTKLGKATLKFKIPQINKTFDIQGLANTQSLTTSIVDKYDIVWQLDKEDVATFNYLNQSITTNSQNYFYLNPDDLVSTFNGFGVDHEGFGIIEGEIVSFKDKEFKFTTTVSDQSSMTPTFYDNDYRVIVGNSAELSTAVSDFSARSGFGGTVKYTPTGKIANVSRGLFNTPVRTHNIIFNTNASSDPNSLYSRMSYYSGEYPSVIDNKIVMPANTIGTYTILTPNGSETSSASHPYHTFSTKMHIGPNADYPMNIGMGGGIVMNLGSTPTYVEIRKTLGTSKSSSGKTTTSFEYRLYVYQGSESNSLLQKENTTVPYFVISSTLLDEVEAYPSNSPFAEFGKTLNLKFVKIENPTSYIDLDTGKIVKNPSFEIHLNKKRLAISTKDVNVDTTGQYGIFTHTTNQQVGTTGSIVFSELYATQSQLDHPAIWYHWQLPSFANALAGGHKVFEINYMMQTKPQVFGVNYYDVQYQLAPAINAYAVPSPYDWYYYTKNPAYNPNKAVPGVSQLLLESIKVSNDALSYSNIYNSGFRGRFAIINGSPSAVWIKKSPDGKNPVDVSFLVNTNDLITLSSEVSVEKVFDPANVNESIEIRSNWVQSKNAALGILKNIFRAIDGFSRDTQVSIYGNPLFEIGDVVKVNYSLKNISNQTYFVQGVYQTFDQGLKTVLVLNQIATS